MLGLLPLFFGCAPPAADTPAVIAPVADVPGPPWPTVPEESPAPAGYSWQTLRHQTVHVRLLVPDGAKVTERVDEEKVPTIEVVHRGLSAVLEVDVGEAWRMPYLAAPVEGAPPTPPGPFVRIDRAPLNVTVQTERAGGAVQVLGLTRGARCVVNLDPFERGPTWIDTAFRICSSLRPAPLGPWGPRVAKQNGTQVPEGAWVEPARPSIVGDSLLGAYAPRLYAGWFVLSHTYCPAGLAAMEAPAAGESEVTVTPRETIVGPAYVRLARAVREAVAFDWGARVVAGRGQGCCVAELPPLVGAPSPLELEYIVALCDTTERFPGGPPPNSLP